MHHVPIIDVNLSIKLRYSNAAVELSRLSRHWKINHFSITVICAIDELSLQRSLHRLLSVIATYHILCCTEKFLLPRFYY